MTKSILTFIIEEHHEAFIVWNYAIKQRLISPNGNTLFHIDEHSDMGSPRFNTSINMINDNLQNIKNFTYRELKIGTFIVPAMYLKIFSKMYWIKPKHKSDKDKSVKMYVRTYNQSGTNLLLDKFENLRNGTFSDLVTFNYNLRTFDSFPSQNKVVLDIDLDTFSCSGNPNELNEIELEITKDEYIKFSNNPYHRLNFLNIGKVEIKKKSGKYYYIFNYYNEIYPNNKKVNKQVIKERINRLIEQLLNKKIKPLMISICRSRYSMYTPTDQWEFIEQYLIEKLSEIYKTELRNINDINFN